MRCWERQSPRVLPPTRAFAVASRQRRPRAGPTISAGRVPSKLPARPKKALAAPRKASPRRAPTWPPGPASRGRGARAAKRARMRAEAGHAFARLDLLGTRSEPRGWRAECFRRRGAEPRIAFRPRVATGHHSICDADSKPIVGKIRDRGPERRRRQAAIARSGCAAAPGIHLLGGAIRRGGQRAADRVLHALDL